MSSEPVPGFRAFMERLVNDKGYGMSSCASHCPDHGGEHAHMSTPDGDDFIAWPDGTASRYDLTRPAALIYPVAARRSP